METTTTTTTKNQTQASSKVGLWVWNWEEFISYGMTVFKRISSKVKGQNLFTAWNQVFQRPWKKVVIDKCPGCGLYDVENVWN